MAAVFVCVVGKAGRLIIAMDVRRGRGFVFSATIIMNAVNLSFHITGIFCSFLSLVHI